VSSEDGCEESRLSTTVLGGENTMPGNYPIDVVLLAMDLATAKDFYADTIGLPVQKYPKNAATNGNRCGRE
jgi:hypothetical protein